MSWWTYQQLRNRNPKTRLAAIEKLVRSGDKKSVEALLFALKDGNAEVRAVAARGLGILGGQPSVESLVPLLRDAEAGVRSCAAGSLEKLGWRPSNDDERLSFLVALGETPEVSEFGLSALEPLVEALMKGTPEKKLAAIKALGESDDSAVIIPLLEALRNGDPSIRVAVLGVLERFSDPATFDAVAPLLQDQNPHVRAASVTAAARCGGANAVPALLKALEDPLWEVRHNAVIALGLLGDATAVDGLSKLFKDTDRDVRESVAQALGRIGDAEAIYPLVLALVDPENSVRRAAETALQLIDRDWDRTAAARRAIPALIVELENQEYWVHHSASKVLERLKLAPPIEKPAPAPTPVEQRASPILPPPVAVVPEAEIDIDAAGRQRAAAMLILTNLLQDPNQYLRLVAMKALEHLQDKEASLSSG